jgi:hypothetical protein
MTGGSAILCLNLGRRDYGESMRAMSPRDDQRSVAGGLGLRSHWCSSLGTGQHPTRD